MSLNAFVNRLHDWVRGQGGEVRQLTYPRPGANATAGAGIGRAVYMAPAGKPRGLVVILHATGNDLYFPFLQLFRLLISRGYSVFSLDLDGHGLGSTHVLSRAHLDSMLPEALVQARRCLAVGPLYLFGQSLGALLCLRFLAQMPATEAPVAGAVLLSTPVSGRISARPMLGELHAAVSPTFWRAAADYGYWGLLPAIGPFKRQQYPLRFAPGEGGLAVAAYAGFVDDLVQASQPLLPAATQRVPCLMLYGSLDALTPPQQAATLAAQLEPSSACVVVAGETHFTLVLSSKCLERVLVWIEQQGRL